MQRKGASWLNRRTFFAERMEGRRHTNAPVTQVPLAGVLSTNTDNYSKNEGDFKRIQEKITVFLHLWGYPPPGSFVSLMSSAHAAEFSSRNPETAFCLFVSEAGMFRILTIAGEALRILCRSHHRDHAMQCVFPHDMNSGGYCNNVGAMASHAAVIQRPRMSPRPRVIHYCLAIAWCLNRHWIQVSFFCSFLVGGGVIQE